MKLILFSLVLGLLVTSCTVLDPYAGGGVPSSPPPPCNTIYWAGRCVFISSIDTMKLSKDQELNGLTDAQINAAVDVVAAQHPTHITVVTHYDYPDTMYRWVTAIRSHGINVWFRDGVKGWGNGSITEDQWMAKYRTFLETYVNNPSYPNFFHAGDVFDPNAETENGYVVLCSCSIYNEPYKTNFNNFLINQTQVADEVFAANGFNQGSTNKERDILTTVHSVDPGSSTGVLNSTFINAMDGLVTVDAYPDQNETDPATAANKWINQLNTIHTKWSTAKILIGEMGYSNTINVTDSQQHDVIAAEMRAFDTTSQPLIGFNYWVGPGAAGDGGYTHIMVKVNGTWVARPAAACIAAFFDRKAGGSASLC